MSRKISVGMLAALVLMAMGVGVFVETVNDYRVDGRLPLDSLEAPVTVYRDEQNIPYIYAGSLADALRAQGFITAQDRLYQMELHRLVAQGRLSELAGVAGVKLDTLTHLLAIPRMGREQASALEEEERAYYEAYVEGINAYLSEMQDEFPLSLAILPSPIEPWTVEDAMAVQFFHVWGVSGNWGAEVLHHRLIQHLGVEKTAEIWRVNANPDREGVPASGVGGRGAGELARFRFQAKDLHGAPAVRSPLARVSGSNAWAVGRSRSETVSLVSDPHIDTRVLPGYWHPVALLTPEVRAIGGGSPGVPGIGIGRTDFIAYGSTVGNSDTVDLFVETVDPENASNYLEGSRSVPFDIEEHTLKIRDAESPGGMREETLVLRRTSRGPVVSDHEIETRHGLLVASSDAGQVVSLRWSVASGSYARLGQRDLLLSKDAFEAREAIGRMIVPLTHVVADRGGNMARVASGRVPMRTTGDGSLPQAVDEEAESWSGFIPWREMPAVVNPKKGWVGTANQNVVPTGYPYAFGTSFATSWRYRRLIELMDADEDVTIDDQWEYAHDVKNVFAERLVPRLIAAWLQDGRTQGLATVLADWDYRDTLEQAGPTIFQSFYQHALRRTFADDLPPDLFAAYGLEYSSQEPFVDLLLGDSGDWFDDQRTETVESRDDILVAAGLDVLEELGERLGGVPSSWHWGRVHTVTFESPVIRGKLAAWALGGGTHPIPGSSETLRSSNLDYQNLYETEYLSSVSLVADLSDPDKVTAVTSGGVSGRIFDDSLDNQVAAYLDGEKRYWWFSDEQIRRHAVSELNLEPGASGRR